MYISNHSDQAARATTSQKLAGFLYFQTENFIEHDNILNMDEHLTKSKDGYGGNNGFEHGQYTSVKSHSLTLYFRSMPPAPGLWTSRRKWNKLIKMVNGNLLRKKEERTPPSAPSFNVITQNIPGKKNEKNVGHL